jgi:cell division protein FtsL
MRNSVRSKSSRVRRKASRGGSFLLWTFLCFVTLIFYFWGRVRIDLNMHENDQLKLERNHIQNEVNDLRARVQEMMSYQRIVDLARKRGMVFVAASNQVNLHVKMDGWKIHDDYLAQRLQYAGLAFPGVKDYPWGAKQR